MARFVLVPLVVGAALLICGAGSADDTIWNIRGGNGASEKTVALATDTIWN
ncbi:hypothetical protein [Kitasatospora sp. NPDC047058]|uniref:hypothetical protein n=1 Tax=Kitasatospora sp. NPDC047058 TaxID=3155620 RepID=UPI0033E4F847